MDYYDGNTVTALWNYAQNYAMSDNHWDSTFGPSTPGALNVISGNTSPAHAIKVSDGTTTTSPAIPDPDPATGNGSVNGDLDPAFDGCSDNGHVSTNPLGVVSSKNIGDLLNTQHITWGWFQGGFTPSGTSTAGFPLCGSTSPNIGGAQVTSTCRTTSRSSTTPPRPTRTTPAVLRGAIGMTDAANHQYDISNFFETLKDGNISSGQLPQAACRPERSPGELRPAGRADLPGQHHQPDPAVEILAVHRDHRYLRRLRRLVRPRGPEHRQRLVGPEHRPAAVLLGGAEAQLVQ
jgi:phospholipase C